MPACISRGEKKQIVRRCQESGLNAFTDWEGTERSCSRSGLQLPRDSPTASFPADPSAHPLQETTSPTRHRTSFKEERKLCGLEGMGDPWEPSPSTHMQSSKHLLLRPRLWGVQRCSRRSQHVPADTAHTHVVSRAAWTLPAALGIVPNDRRSIISVAGPCPRGVGHLVCEAPSRNHRWMSWPRPLRAGGRDPSRPRWVTD